MSWGAAGHPLVPDEVIAPDERDADALDVGIHPTRIGLVEVDSVDGGQDVDTYRWIAELDDRILMVEVSRAQPHLTEAEVAERMHQASGVVRLDPHPDVEILGRPRESVRGYGIAANYEVADVTGVQALDELAEVGFELHGRRHRVRRAPAGSR